MANTLITNQYIARRFIQLSRNTNAFLMSVDRQYDAEFDRAGAKAGQSIRIRLPADYTYRTGATAVVQDSTQKSLTLTVSTQGGVDMGFSSVERTMQVDKFDENFIKPAVNTVVGGIAADIMSNVEGGISGWAANYDGSGNIVTPKLQTWTDAKAVLQRNAVPTSDYQITMAPNTQSATIAQFSTLYNSQPVIAKQYENGDMTRALGFDWMTDQTVLVHTTGTLASSGSTYTAGKGWSFGTISGANQTGTSLTVAALTGTLKKGDIITVDGVLGVNPVTKGSTGTPRHFTVTADVAASATSIPIYPSLLGVDGSSNPQRFQTVTASPANSAVVYCVSKASSQYYKNFAYVPKFFTLATVDLIMPPNVDAAREVFDETSVRVVTQYAVGTDVLTTRLDILYGSLAVKPEWAVVVPDVLP